MQLTNAGLVKRAVRELDGGYTPALALDASDTLVATFEDGVITTWTKDTPILKVLCTCGAPGACRHRLIAALAFRAQPSDGDPGAGAQADAQPVLASPGSVDEDTLARCVSPTRYAVAQRERDAGIAIEVRRRSAGEPCDTARLPAATVRYWAGPALGSARCDCVQQSACEHVALGAWAFREADRVAPEAATYAVRLGAGASAVSVDRSPYLALISALLARGATGGPTPVATEISSALNAARDSGAEWLLQGVIEIENTLAAYSARSAHYAPEQLADCIAELWLRLTIGALPGNAKAVLGIGQARETELDRLRLMCLGARTFRDADTRRTRLVLADIDTGTRLALSHNWRVPADRIADEASIRSSERVVPGVRLSQLAEGQLLSQQARRLADGTLLLAKARSNQNSILPQLADWSMLAPPVRFESFHALRQDRQSRPHAMAAPRHAAGEFVIVTCAHVGDAFYDPNHQTVVFKVDDVDGATVIVSRTYESHVRHALEAIAAACAGVYGPIRHVAGVLSVRGGALHLDPWAMGCDRIVVPDFADATVDNGAGALAQLPLGYAGDSGADTIAGALAQLQRSIAALLHHGVLHATRHVVSDLDEASRRLAVAELKVLARAVGEFAQSVREEHAKPSDRSALAAALAALLALRQLHEDALGLASLGETDSPPTT